MDQNSREESTLVVLRKKKALTQRALAEALGVTEQTVRNWEQGRVEPRFTLAQIKAFCKVLDLSLEDLPESLGPQNAN